MPYWAELWPSGVALAQAIAGRALKGATVLELGCGLGLPSLAAARAGGRVLAVDWSAAAIELLEANAERNGVAVEGRVASWTDPAPLLARAPFRLVLAADVLYEQRNVPVLADLLPRLGWRGAARGSGAAAPARVPRRGRDRVGAPAGVPPALTGGPDPRPRSAGRGALEDRAEVGLQRDPAVRRRGGVALEPCGHGRRGRARSTDRRPCPAATRAAGATRRRRRHRRRRRGAGTARSCPSRSCPRSTGRNGRGTTAAPADAAIASRRRVGLFRGQTPKLDRERDAVPRGPHVAQSVHLAVGVDRQEPRRVRGDARRRAAEEPRQRDDAVDVDPPHPGMHDDGRGVPLLRGRRPRTSSRGRRCRRAGARPGSPPSPRARRRPAAPARA